MTTMSDRSHTTPPDAIDLDAYFQRIGYRGPRVATRDVLHAIHLAHATSIPFENLDILLGRPIRIDLSSVQNKLVHGGRGGYCFEQNLLLSTALEALGFAVQRLAGRVRFGTTRVLPRTHMTLLVEAEGEKFLADVGFGGGGMPHPLPFVVDREAVRFGRRHRIIQAEPGWLLQSVWSGAWTDLYAFTLEPQQAADYEMANYYVSTHPESRFTQTLTVQRLSTDTTHVLRNRNLYTIRDGKTDIRTIADDAELLNVLAETFGLPLPPGTRLAFRDEQA